MTLMLSVCLGVALLLASVEGCLQEASAVYKQAVGTLASFDYYSAGQAMTDASAYCKKNQWRGAGQCLADAFPTFKLDDSKQGLKDAADKAGEFCSNDNASDAAQCIKAVSAAYKEAVGNMANFDYYSADQAMTDASAYCKKNQWRGAGQCLADAFPTFKLDDSKQGLKDAADKAGEFCSDDNASDAATKAKNLAVTKAATFLAAEHSTSTSLPTTAMACIAAMASLGGLAVFMRSRRQQESEALLEVHPDMYTALA